MAGHELFAVMFIFFVMFGLYTATFFELGGDKALGEFLLRLIESRTNKRKKKDI